jgi:hypothetical protein
MKVTFRALAVLAAIVLLSRPTGAQTAGGTGHNGPCKSYVQTFCEGMKKGDERIIDCLEQHSMDLSSDCKAHMQKVKRYNAMAHKAQHGKRTAGARSAANGSPAAMPAQGNSAQEQKSEQGQKGDNALWDFDDNQHGK